MAKYPNGKVDDADPGVAYARPAEGEEDGIVYFNRMVTNYSITIHSKNKSGVTVASDYTVQTPRVLDGNEVKMNIVAQEVEGYKPRYATEKVIFTSASTEHTITYLAATSYTVTVHHVFSGETLTGDTEIVIEDIFEEDVVNVTIEPEDISGYRAEPVNISVSGDMEYTLEYEEEICYVDLGLPSGTLWACKNLGAEDEYDVGNFYAWGEIVPNKAEYTKETYRFYNNGSYTKYGNVDDKWLLDSEDDVAKLELGGSWHMPSTDQMYELINNTTATYDVNYQYTIFTSNINGNLLVVPIVQVGDSYDCNSFWGRELIEDGIEHRTAVAFNFGCEGSFGPTTHTAYSSCPVRGVIGGGNSIDF